MRLCKFPVSPWSFSHQFLTCIDDSCLKCLLLRSSPNGDFCAFNIPSIFISWYSILRKTFSFFIYLCKHGLMDSFLMDYKLLLLFDAHFVPFKLPIPQIQLLPPLLSPELSVTLFELYLKRVIHLHSLLPLFSFAQPWDSSLLGVAVGHSLALYSIPLFLTQSILLMNICNVSSFALTYSTVWILFYVSFVHICMHFCWGFTWDATHKFSKIVAPVYTSTISLSIP